MARKKIREYHGKKILKQHINRFSRLSFAAQVKPVIVTKETLATEWKKLKAANPWLTEERLVAKPDMLFGKRGKYGLVKVNADLKEVKQFIKDKIDVPFTVQNIQGLLTHWIIEPFVPHDVEFYFSMESAREYTLVRFSHQGGIYVEENWDKVKELKVPVGQKVSDFPQSDLDGFYDGVPENMKEAVAEYVNAMFQLFEDLDFVSLETNPFTLVKTDDEAHSVNGWQPVPLDLVAELDDTAHFKQSRKWGDLVFPETWGTQRIPEEQFIEELDAKTGASLKFTVLNPAPTGRIWTLVAGGGASVIFADTVADLGWGNVLGNYGEYSGGPDAEQMFQYTRTVLSVATANPDGRGRVLLIGGGIANFTDVAKTFTGIVHALKEYKQKLVDAKMQIYVRRAGPNFKKGLELMQSVGRDLGVPTFVYGPELTMTDIVPMAIEYLKQS